MAGWPQLRTDRDGRRVRQCGSGGSPRSTFRCCQLIQLMTAFDKACPAIANDVGHLQRGLAQSFARRLRCSREARCRADRVGLASR